MRNIIIGPWRNKGAGGKLKCPVSFCTEHGRTDKAGHIPRPDAVSALCSGKLRYTTGNYIDVDGGFHIRRL